MYHISKNPHLSYLDPKLDEKFKTRIVRFAKTIDGCLYLLRPEIDPNEECIYYVYAPQKDNVNDYLPYREKPESKLTGEAWVMDTIPVKRVHMIRVNNLKPDIKRNTRGKINLKIYDWESIEPEVSNSDDITSFDGVICVPNGVFSEIEMYNKQHISPTIRETPEDINDIDDAALDALDSDTPAMSALPYIRNKTEEICNFAVEINPESIKFLEKQTTQLCLAAVEENGECLKFVRKQTPEICKAAIRENAENFEYVLKQTEELCIFAIERNYSNFRYVREQTHDICIRAVSKYPYNLAYVRNQTKEICETAIYKDAGALQFVREQTPEICMYAIEEDAACFRFVITQTPEICKAAVQADPSNLVYVRKQTFELLKVAMETLSLQGMVPDAIQYIRNQTEEMALYAVNKDGTLLQYIHDKTMDVCLAAIKNNPKAALFCPFPIKTLPIVE